MARMRNVGVYELATENHLPMFDAAMVDGLAPGDIHEYDCIGMLRLEIHREDIGGADYYITRTGDDWISGEPRLTASDAAREIRARNKTHM